MKNLAGKWALVTGSSRGIGRQIAVGLAKLSCNVILHGRSVGNCADTLALVKDHGVEAAVVSGNLANPDDVISVIDQTNAIAQIDILYNNAGLQNEWKEVWDLNHGEWLEIFQVNLFSLVKLTQAFAPQMKARSFGRIINLTSGIADIPQMAPYSAAKAAVDKFTTDMAAELKGSNVLINTVDPGWLRTDLGGPEGDFDVETVVPGALVPALLEDFGPQGTCFHAQEFKYLSI